MKNMKMWVTFFWPVFLLVGSAVAQDSNLHHTGFGLSNQCRVATTGDASKLLPPPADKCLWYINGWLEGVDGTLISDDKGVLQTATVTVTVEYSQTYSPTLLEIARAYVLYIHDHPQEKDKLRQDALRDAMLDAGFLKLSRTNPTDNSKASSGIESSSPAQQSSVTLKSTPAGADINVDGKWMGNTPSTIRLSAGEHEISIEKEGMTPWQRNMTVSAGGTIDIDAKLEKPRSVATR